MNRLPSFWSTPRGKSLSDYEGDRALQLAVERLFEIVGEALNRLKRAAPDIVDSIPDFRKIIAFRNILAHGYDVIENEQVWDIVEHEATDLYQAVLTLLGE